MTRLAQHDASRALVLAWVAPDAEQARLRTRFAHLLSSAAGLRRDGGPEHVTASCLVLDEDASAVLLVHHAKGGFWVQPGGHVEPADADVRAAAVREVREETGFDLGSPDVTAGPVRLLDLHTHALSAAFGSCRVHHDVMFVARTRGRPEPRLSAESTAVRWFDVDDLPGDVVADLPARMARAVQLG